MVGLEESSIPVSEVLEIHAMVDSMELAVLGKHAAYLAGDSAKKKLL